MSHERPHRTGVALWGTAVVGALPGRLGPLTPGGRGIEIVRLGGCPVAATALAVWFVQR